MSSHVDLTGRAYADLDRLIASLAERSPEAADRLCAEFFQGASPPGIQSVLMWDCL
jgi:hypothetical protein